jgi:thioester reductase-like protein
MENFTDQENDLLKKALLKIEMQKNKIASLQNQLIEPIAIIGLGCRFPGGANDPEAFWKLLEQGFDATTEVPADRWNMEEYYSDNEELAGKSYARHGAFITTSIDAFDPLFFNISPKEAEMLDPRQRLLLEVVWEALENAGIPEPEFRNSLTGVFMGMMNNDYAELLHNVDDVNAHTSVGLISSLLAGRISYAFGLQGPSVAIDTACSSSLVSVHLACQSLRLGECNLAIAGGVNLMLSPKLHVICSKGKMLAKDGHCKTFDSSADGYVRGEGCGTIILKRLRDALNENNNILAVIKGSAVNQDGASSGLTVPNGAAQERVITQAMRQAQLTSNEIDYIEMHGTGTRIGDPIEVNALNAIFSAPDKQREKPLILGTVKTNIGHLEAAAGIASIIKTVLALNHKTIPQHLHLHQINPMIDLSQIPAQVPLVKLPWEAQEGRTRKAGISAFGISGTNAHLIIEEAPQHRELESVSSDSKTQEKEVLVISAKTSEALDAQIDNYIKFLKNTQHSLENICYSSQHARTQFESSIAVTGVTIQELIERLENKQWASNEEISLALRTKNTAIKKIALPLYQFVRQRYWINSSENENLVQIADAEPFKVENQEYLLSLDSQERQQYILARVREIILLIIGIESTPLHDDTEFLALGLDSLMAAETNKMLAKAFPFMTLNNAITFDYPSIKRLADYLAVQILSEDKPATENADALSTEDLTKKITPIIYDPKLIAQERKLTHICLLTGATGFLGAHLLSDLVNGTQDTIYCLIRCTGSDEPQEKLVKALKLYDLYEKIDLSRVSAVIGDFSKPQLGLDSEVYARLSAELDSIYHVGAEVNFIKPLSLLTEANVNSCEYILELAQNGNLKHVHYISTLAALPRSGDYMTADLNENTPLNLSGNLVGGYEQSKWLGEIVMRNAQQQQLPITIYRPGLIGGSLATGLLNNKDVFTRSLQTFIETGSIPDNMSFNFNVVPVDYITQSIVYLAAQPNRLNVYHFYHDLPITTQDIYASLVSSGMAINMEDYSTWSQRLEEWGENHDYALKPLLSFLARNEVSDQKQLNVQAMLVDQGNIYADLTKEALPEYIKEKLWMPKELVDLYVKKLIASEKNKG